MKRKSVSALFLAGLLAAGSILLSSCCSACPKKPSEVVQCEKVITGYADRNCFSGACAMVVGKNGIQRSAYGGKADLETGRPFTPDTLFQLASITKPFTAVAFMQLVDAGKVKLDDPVSKYLPYLKDLKVVRKQTKDEVVLGKPQTVLTIRHLLSNTGGMRFLARIQGGDLTRVPLSVAVLSLADLPLRCEPGSRFIYADSHFNVLAHIIEKISGMRLSEYMRKNLFDPMGMKDTTFFPDKGQLRRMAVMYAADKTKTGLVKSQFALMDRPLDAPGRYEEAGAGLFSTPQDMARFAEMLLNEGNFRGKQIISKEAFRQLSSVQTPKTETKHPYGFGFHVRPNCIFHGGAGGSDLKIYKDKPFAFLWFTQQYFCKYANDGANAEAEAEKILLGSGVCEESNGERIDRTGVKK